MRGGESFSLPVPPELIERIAAQAAAIVLLRLGAQTNAAQSPFLTVTEAADFLRCSRQRVDDLLSQRRLARFKDGRRTLVSRVELAAYVTESGSRRIAPALPSIPQSRMVVRRLARPPD